jgi:catechol 2,3-dioxygenase-like lactoylglutathione lyase family enzyme
MNLTTAEIKAFVPSQDFEKSKAFYLALGFEIPWSSEDLAYVRHGQTSFLLQSFQDPEHASDFQMHLLVENVDDWHAHVRASGVDVRFGVAIGEPENRPWAMRDFTLFDPSGVLWRIAQNIPRKAGPLLSAQLPGTWDLVSRIDVAASGERRREPSLGDRPIAVLFYDRSGHFAAQFMKRDRSVSAPDAPPGTPNNSRAQGGYDAYFGTYTVDDGRGTVTQELLGALSSENVGSVLTRAMAVQGEALTIALQTTSPYGEPVTRTLTWKRVG